MIAIRPFAEADAPTVAALIQRTLQISNAADYPPREIERLVKRHTPGYIRERASWTHFYVAWAADAVAGCGAIGPNRGRSDESCLFTIFVDPDRQGQGVGRRIVEALENDEYFLRAGRVAVHASITARGFYQKLGYVGGDAPDGDGLYYMEKCLD